VSDEKHVGEKHPGEKHPGEKHVYDDIVELDNQLPRWWLWTLYLTVAFSIPYFGYYACGPGPTLVEEYQRERGERELRELAEKAKRPPLDEGELTRVTADPARRKAGRELYSARCVSCHGSAGEGGIGPNLTDRYWLHGGKLTQVALTITQGVPDKGMPPWGAALRPEEVSSVVAYLRSIAGSNPPRGKAPQGDPSP
jgi:cytochrome c oxidase cbb3-type subunit III